MNNHDLLQLARQTLTTDELTVWITKNAGYGRRAGSLTLGITEDQWRYRLRNATMKLDAAIRERKDAA